MSETIKQSIDILQNNIDTECIGHRKGLIEESFFFASKLMPTMSIDNLVTNKNREIPFTCREENHHGKGWHIPGGCVKLQEKLGKRVKKTAIKELGTEVDFAPEPIWSR